MKNITMNTLLAIILALFGCDANQDDFRSQIDSDKGNYIQSEKLNYWVDTIATGLQNPWGLAFLPNNDLLVTERDGEIRIIREGKLLEQKIRGVPEVYSRGQGGLFELLLHPD